MKKLNYNDTVRVSDVAPKEYRPGQLASVIGITEDAATLTYKKFPPGTVYLIEFEDGVAIDVPQVFLMSAKFNSQNTIE